MRCAVKNCNNNNKTKPYTLSFFTFPSDTKLLEQWKRFCCRDNNMNVKTSHVCMEHFKPEDFENSLQFRMGFTKRLFLKRGAVPSVCTASSTDKKRRNKKRKNKTATKSVSGNVVNEPPEQPMEAEVFIDDEFHIKPEFLSDDEINPEQDVKPISCNVEVNIPPKLTMGTQTFTEEQIQVKSEALLEDTHTARNEQVNSSKQTMESELFMEPEIHIKSEELSENENFAEFASCNEITELKPREPEVLLEYDSVKVTGNNDETNKIKCIKMEMERLFKEKCELQKSLKNQKVELKSLQEKEERDSKIFNVLMDCLKTQLKQANFELNNLEQKLLSIFSKGQIAKLKSGIKSTKWSDEDITQGITLYAACPKFYLLLYMKHFPLPAVHILQSWAQNVQITPGLLEPVFKLLSASTHMTEVDKICVLSFGQTKLKNVYCYDMTTDTTLAPANNVLVAMIRGLIAKWQQPIFYKYDSEMTAYILNNILFKLKTCGYTVAAIVSDLEGSTGALFNKLQVTEEKPWFTFDGEKVFVLAEVPHMIKVMRNHFVDEGFSISGKPVCSEIISKLSEISSADLSITQKISQTNPNDGNVKEQNVKLATKLFSHSVAQAITRAASQGSLEGLNWEECHRLIKLTHDWFNVMNFKIHYSDSSVLCQAYGLSLARQNRILDEMTQIVKEIRVIGQETLLPFQKGIIQSNNALKMLYENMMSRYNLKFILTYRLNQEILENFFERTSAKGVQNDDLDQLEFQYRLRSYILDGVKSENNDTRTLGLEKLEKSLTGNIIGVLNADVNPIVPVEQELTDIPCNGLENLAVYICHKLKYDLPDSTASENKELTTNSCLDHLSEGGLWKPTQKTMQQMQKLDKVFESNNARGLHITNGFIRSLIKKAHHITCDEKVKELFFRTKMYLKIRKLNQEIEDNVSSK